MYIIIIKINNIVMSKICIIYIWFSFTEALWYTCLITGIKQENTWNKSNDT